MLATVIIDRIRGAIEGGQLADVVETTRFKPLLTMGDLLQPWCDVFPDMDVFREDGEDVHDLRARRTGGVRNKPKFTPRPRRSARLLPAPRLLRPTPKLVHPDLFRSVSAVWDWYLLKGKGDPALLHQPFTDDGFMKFTDYLSVVLSDYYPLGCDLEHMSESVHDMCAITLRLPIFSYDDEGAGVIQAFFEGAEGLHWMMQGFQKSQEWDLPKSDLKLIEEAGWLPLAQAYSEYSGEKTYNLERLYDTETSYFQDVKNTYPDLFGEGVDLIDDGYGHEVFLRSPEDIEFGIAYAEAWYKMEGDLPSGQDFEYNEQGITANFAHEICNVWRKTHGKRAVKWQSDNRTLVYR